EPKHLTISVTPTFAARWLMPRLPAFTAAHPDIDLRILATDRLSIFQTDAVDIAVRYGRPSFGPGLSAELLFEQVIVAVASPLLVEKLGPPDAGDNLARYALLHDAHNFWPQFLERTYPKGAIASAKNIRFNQASLAIDAAIAGQGLALASLFFVQEDIASGRLVRPFATELRVEADFYLVSPRKPRHPEPIAAVRSWLMEAARLVPVRAGCVRRQARGAAARSAAELLGARLAAWLQFLRRPGFPNSGTGRAGRASGRA